MRYGKKAGTSDNNMRKPSWLKVTGFQGREYDHVNHLLKKYRLNTVCQAANCPNRGECFNDGTATFLIMGPNCSRNCRFCDINPGQPAPLDNTEPERLAEVASEMRLKHVVVTSVTRDDLADGGAGHFVKTVAAIRNKMPESTIEILTPDFKNAPRAVEIILKEPPDIFNHNIETVPRLYPEVRPGADYEISLNLLCEIARLSEIPVKSGLMLGLGETCEELKQVFSDIAHRGVSIVTIGQYLSPSREHYPVKRYVSPGEFEEIGDMARKAGIKNVASAPLVRSSYHAAQFVDKARR